MLTPKALGQLVSLNKNYNFHLQDNGSKPLPHGMKKYVFTRADVGQIWYQTRTVPFTGSRNESKAHPGMNELGQALGRLMGRIFNT